MGVRYGVVVTDVVFRDCHCCESCHGSCRLFSMLRLPLLLLSDCVLRCSCCCCSGVPVALGAKDVLAILLIAGVLTLLMMIKDCCRSAFHCCVVVYASRLPLLLPLPNCVPVVAAAAVVFLLHLERGRHGDKDVDRELADIVHVDNGLLRRKTNKQTNVCYIVIVTEVNAS